MIWTVNVFFEGAIFSQFHLENSGKADAFFKKTIKAFLVWTISETAR